jgi:hypothetical protein
MDAKQVSDKEAAIDAAFEQGPIAPGEPPAPTLALPPTPPPPPRDVPTSPPGSPLGDYVREIQKEFEAQEDEGKLSTGG